MIMDGTFRFSAFKFNPTFEMRRRISDREKRSLSLILTVGWLVLTLTVTTIILLLDYRRFEVTFQEHTRNLKIQILSRIKENETVLEGFSAYLSGMGEFDEQRVDSFAQQIKQRFPYVSMLQVVEQADTDGLEALIQRQQRTGHRDFEVKLPSDSKRLLEHSRQGSHHYPVIYQYPLNKTTPPLLGTDLAFHAQLKEPLQKVFATGKPQTSIPFKQGNQGEVYAMFHPVLEADPGADQNKRATYVAFIVLPVAHLLSGLDEGILSDSTDLLIYHDQHAADDVTGHFYQSVSHTSSLLPKLTFSCPLELETSGITLHMQRSFGFRELSKGPILAVILASILVFVFIRLFTLKRYVLDIDRARQEVRLEVLASHDALTHLPNRYQLMNWLDDKLQGQETPSRLAALFLDLDDFKQINDLYGHRVGDSVLQVVAERIRQELRREDLAVRLGGDEFLVIISGFSDSHGVDQVAEKLRRKIEAPIKIDKLVLYVGVSVGIARFPDQVASPAELIEQADLSMYQDKQNRRMNKVQTINGRH